MTFRTHPRRRALTLAAVALCAACESRAPLKSASVAPTACDGCHGAPPATGAHLAHSAAALRPALAYGDLAVLEDFALSGTAYGFGCGHCHPLDEAAHLADAGSDGAPDVELAPPADGSAAGSLRARSSPSATWDAATGTCRGVYCHSSGTDVPTYVETPPWAAPAGALGCDGCHGNPPRYASSGADLAAPNSHLQLAQDGWEWGHYAGLPGPWHGTLPGSTVGHGVDGAASAPMTCQTCHFDTVDPANTAPGGFRYLDTSGDYALPGGDAARADDPLWKRTQCATCHDGVHAPTGRGKVLPLRHVNGRKDVAFDPRLALPAGYATGLPAPVAAEPVAPYYVSPFDVTVAGWTLPAGAEARTGQDGSSALVFTLAGAAYDPATRTCSNVACHLARQSMVDAGQAQPLRWGMPYVSSWSCEYCHGMGY